MDRRKPLLTPRLWHEVAAPVYAHTQSPTSAACDC